MIAEPSAWRRQGVGISQEALDILYPDPAERSEQDSPRTPDYLGGQEQGDLGQLLCSEGRVPRSDFLKSCGRLGRCDRLGPATRRMRGRSSTTPPSIGQLMQDS